MVEVTPSGSPSHKHIVKRLRLADCFMDNGCIDAERNVPQMNSLNLSFREEEHRLEQDRDGYSTPRNHVSLTADINRRTVEIIDIDRKRWHVKLAEGMTCADVLRTVGRDPDFYRLVDWGSGEEPFSYVRIQDMQLVNGHTFIVRVGTNLIITDRPVVTNFEIHDGRQSIVRLLSAVSNMSEFVAA